MFRFLFRLVMLVVVVGVIGAAYVAYRWSSDHADQPVGTTGTILSDRARQAGSAIADTVAEGATRAEKALAEGGLTAKIKSKITLDDTLKGAEIDVDTRGTVVTVAGRVDTKAQRERVVQLARETAGVTKVVDQVEVRR
jgi:hypothetical protein